MERIEQAFTAFDMDEFSKLIHDYIENDTKIVADIFAKTNKSNKVKNADPNNYIMNVANTYNIQITAEDLQYMDEHTDIKNKITDIANESRKDREMDKTFTIKAGDFSMVKPSGETIVSTGPVQMSFTKIKPQPEHLIAKCDYDILGITRDAIYTYVRGVGFTNDRGEVKGSWFKDSEHLLSIYGSYFVRYGVDSTISDVDIMDMVFLSGLADEMGVPINHSDIVFLKSNPELIKKLIDVVKNKYPKPINEPIEYNNYDKPKTRVVYKGFEHGCPYHFIHGDLIHEYVFDANDICSKILISDGKCFETRQEAERKLEIMKLLSKYIMGPDDKYSNYYTIKPNSDEKKLIAYHADYYCLPIVCVKERRDAEEIIANITIEEYFKYIIGRNI